ncbi:outer membrane beta-barrel protein [Pontibacter arcticus]|uniref:Thrombospondin type 3 repeat-containing protein n=1 Tax=Pontibacter arcticus TaxID=2080288 RepID=A0A364RD06_9BACT|nr:outer membrane beta-barrel protein [Pontibacter arcticus]RAU82036.1 thrombospondin type 3 repeat-containing protein [Pontibacter arcticus]
MGKKLYAQITFILLFSLLPYFVQAQPNFLPKGRESLTPERGLVFIAGAGIAAVKSDICRGWGCNNFGPNFSVGALYKLSPKFGISGNVNYARLGAQESEKWRKLNVSFQTEVIEVSGTVVLNLLDSYSGTGYRSSRKRFIVPYVKAGAGLIYYTAISYPGQGKLDEAPVKDDPERDYPAVAAVIPFGGGLRFRINDQISIAPELMYQISTTDFLDNISARFGNPNTNDHYGTASVKIMYTPVVKSEVFTRRPRTK